MVTCSLDFLLVSTSLILSASNSPSELVWNEVHPPIMSGINLGKELDVLVYTNLWNYNRLHLISKKIDYGIDALQFFVTCERACMLRT